MNYQQRCAAEANAVIALLAKTYPFCFAVRECKRKPLIIGVHKLLLETGVVAPRELANALRNYTSNAGYLRNLLAGAWRIELDGKPVGAVTKAEEINAKARLAAMAARSQRRATAAQSARLKTSIAGLREAGRRRKGIAAA
jgi:ProP effector